MRSHMLEGGGTEAEMPYHNQLPWNYRLPT